jgi:hypothetical protein
MTDWAQRLINAAQEAARRERSQRLNAAELYALANSICNGKWCSPLRRPESRGRVEHRGRPHRFGEVGRGDRGTPGLPVGAHRDEGAEMTDCICLPPGGSYESYEGPQRDCPVHGELPGPRTLTVNWHPDAISRAVEHGIAVTQTVDPDPIVYASPAAELTWMDLACLVDIARTWIRSEQEPR